MKTITDSEIELFISEESQQDWNDLAFRNIYKEGMRTGIRWYRSQIEDQEQWIDVNERFPEKQGHYFVKVLNSYPKNCDVIVCEFYEDNKTFYGESCDSPIYDPLMWMEIPKTK